MYYDQTAQEFLQKWPAKPTNEELEEVGKDPQQLSDAQQTRVRLLFFSLPDCALTTIIASKFTSGSKPFVVSETWLLRPMVPST